MKLISIILTLFTSIASANPIYVSSKECLKDILLHLQPGERIWIKGGLADSIENQIIEEMIREFPWQDMLQGWEPLTFDDYRRIILEHGLMMIHTEVHRKILQEPDIQWISDLGLDLNEQHAFAEEFFFRFNQKNGRVHREVLLQIGFSDQAF